MKWVLAVYRKIVPDKVRKAYNEKLQKIRIAYKNKRAMRRRHYGHLNKDKTFYVICSEWTQTWGIATTACIVLNNIKYAVEHGWIPIVDYKNYYLYGIQDESDKGRENAWEYYFEQPVSGYSLEDVYQSKNVILAPDKGQPYGSMDWKNMKELSDEAYTIYYELIEKYIRLKPELLGRVEEKKRTLFGRASGKKILGVGMRAGLYWGEVVNSDAYAHHPKGMSIEEYIEMTYQYMKRFGCEYVFISCDDRYCLERMKQEFGEKCLYLEDRSLAHYFDENGSAIIDVEERVVEMKKESIAKRSADYLVETYLLSACDSLFRVQGGGSVLACLLNSRKYENYYMVDRGMYRGTV